MEKTNNIILKLEENLDAEIKIIESRIEKLKSKEEKLAVFKKTFSDGITLEKMLECSPEELFNFIDSHDISSYFTLEQLVYLNRVLTNPVFKDSNSLRYKNALMDFERLMNYFKRVFSERSKSFEIKEYKRELELFTKLRNHFKDGRVVNTIASLNEVLEFVQGNYIGEFTEEQILELVIAITKSNVELANRIERDCKDEMSSKRIKSQESVQMTIDEIIPDVVEEEEKVETSEEKVEVEIPKEKEDMLPDYVTISLSEEQQQKFDEIKSYVNLLKLQNYHISEIHKVVAQTMFDLYMGSNIKIEEVKECLADKSHYLEFVRMVLDNKIFSIEDFISDNHLVSDKDDDLELLNMEFDALIEFFNCELLPNIISENEKEISNDVVEDDELLPILFTNDGYDFHQSLKSFSGIRANIIKAIDSIRHGHTKRDAFILRHAGAVMGLKIHGGKEVVIYKRTYDDYIIVYGVCDRSYLSRLNKGEISCDKEEQIIKDGGEVLETKLAESKDILNKFIENEMGTFGK